MPRIIEQDAWSVVDQCVQQRVRVLEAFLEDVYDTGRVFDDGVIPRGVVTPSSHYHRVASGVSYVITNRRAISSALSEAFATHRIRPVGS